MSIAIIIVVLCGVLCAQCVALYMVVSNRADAVRAESRRPPARTQEDYLEGLYGDGDDFDARLEKECRDMGIKIPEKLRSDYGKKTNRYVDGEVVDAQEFPRLPYARK